MSLYLQSFLAYLTYINLRRLNRDMLQVIALSYL